MGAWVMINAGWYKTKVRKRLWFNCTAFASLLDKKKGARRRPFLFASGADQSLTDMFAKKLRPR